MNNRNYIIFDTETTGLDETSCGITELAAIAINPRTLEIIPDSEFESFMKPDMSVDKDGKYIKDMSAIKFHCENQTKILGRVVEPQEILDKWTANPEPSEVWPKFLGYLERYHNSQKQRNQWTAPIPVGHNIIRFDLPIVKRYHELYGNGKIIWNPRDNVDLMNYLQYWFEGCPHVKSYSMDTMRDWLNIPKDGAHTAIVDVKQMAMVFCRFLKFQREIAKSRDWFKESFAAA